MSTSLTPGSAPIGTTTPAAPTSQLPAGLVEPVRVPPAPTPSPTPAPVTSHVVPLVPPGERRRRKAPLAWLPWAALAALLALLALALLAGTLGGSDDRAATRGTGAPAAGGAAAAGAAGALTVAGADALADTRSVGRLSGSVGEAAVGRGVLVQQVVADEGFWVGSSAAQRVFVFLTPEARRSAGESAFQVREGQRLDLNGTVADLGGDPSRFGVTDTEGARQLAQQRAYVRASQVRLTS